MISGGNNERLAREFFRNLNLPWPAEGCSVEDALAALDPEWLEEFGLTAEEIPLRLAEFLETMTRASALRPLRSLTVLGGRDKAGAPEEAELRLVPGDAVSVVGPTGSGKSRLLADIECLAQGDTPTGRRVLIDDAPVDEDERFRLGGKLVAQLSQNMNFVMDLTVAEFLEMHARSRMPDSADSDVEAACAHCFERANGLAGERFAQDTKVTQLSGGQSRALMIADCAYLSRSPVVLIDEIENAGVDRREALALLSSREKIVLISTHDPLLALEADRRVVIRGGGIRQVIETDEEERSALAALEAIDRTLREARQQLRYGESVRIP
ncbi:MAG: ATP-binding cassette domain-containing protein [Clostridiales Family XIII bacterium]|jgi:ABC-type lipoprotein export system ATPase subunit|nr:ATP-binding cassette domain-containing protein [Clostridiales Family XIII bacterium]